MAVESTLVIVKPDGVRRGLIGMVISRLEQCGLTIVSMKMVEATKELIGRHYAEDPTWLDTAGSRAISTMTDAGMDWKELTGADNTMDVGRAIRNRLMVYMTSGPVAVIIARGPQAVGKVRQIIGSTVPLDAAPGSIRGTYCTDDVISSFNEKRALENVIHASGSVDEASQEIALWF